MADASTDTETLAEEAPREKEPFVPMELEAAPEVYALRIDKDGVITGYMKTNLEPQGFEIVDAETYAEAQAMAGRVKLISGKLVEFEPPTLPAPVPFEISDRQFFQALASEPYSKISTQEALDAVKTGEIPAIMQAVIDALPTERQFPITMLIAGAKTFQRNNPVVGIFAASQNMDEAATDDFFRFAGSL